MLPQKLKRETSCQSWKREAVLWARRQGLRLVPQHAVMISPAQVWWAVLLEVTSPCLTGMWWLLSPLCPDGRPAETAVTQPLRIQSPPPQPTMRSVIRHVVETDWLEMS